MAPNARSRTTAVLTAAVQADRSAPYPSNVAEADPERTTRPRGRPSLTAKCDRVLSGPHARGQGKNSSVVIVRGALSAPYAEGIGVVSGDTGPKCVGVPGNARRHVLGPGRVPSGSRYTASLSPRGTVDQAVPRRALFAGVC